MITISPSVAQAIAHHAEQTYPDECVGLFIGTLEETTKHVHRVYPLENRWDGQVTLSEHDNAESRHDHFYLDPRDYLRADHEARTSNMDVIGCYHSHPDSAAVPSERDRIGAQGVGGGHGFSFVIQRVDNGSATDCTSWLLLDNGTRFEAETIVVE